MTEKQTYILVRRRWWHLFARKDTYLDRVLADPDTHPIGTVKVSIPVVQSLKTGRVMVPVCFVDLNLPLGYEEYPSCLSEVHKNEPTSKESNHLSMQAARCGHRYDRRLLYSFPVCRIFVYSWRHIWGNLRPHRSHSQGVNGSGA